MLALGSDLTLIPGNPKHYDGPLLGMFIINNKWYPGQDLTHSRSIGSMTHPVIIFPITKLYSEDSHISFSDHSIIVMEVGALKPSLPLCLGQDNKLN